MCVRDKAKFGSMEEAKSTWEVGKGLGWYARKNDEVVNALANLHMEKEDGMKRTHVKGK